MAIAEFRLGPDEDIVGSDNRGEALVQALLESLPMEMPSIERVARARSIGPVLW